MQQHGLGADVLATDHKSVENAQAKHIQLRFSESIENTLTDAELVVLVTEWPEFVDIDPILGYQLGEDPHHHRRPQCHRRCRVAAAGWTYQGMDRP